MNKKYWEVLEVIIFVTFGIVLTVLRFSEINKIEPIFDTYDSPSYFKFELVGGVRMPLITFIFSHLENLNLIIKFQTFVSSFVTIIFAITFIKIFDSIFSKVLFFVLIIFLLFSPNILYLDYYIMAESLNLSAILLILISFALFLKKEQSNFYLFLLILSLIIFAGIKSVNGFVSVLALMVILLYLVYKYLYLKTYIKSFFFYLNIFFLAIFTPLILFITLNISATPILNTSAIINSRLWENKDWRNYILDKKFPLEARTTFLEFSENNLGSPPDAAVADLEEYKKWYDSEGKNFLLYFMKDNLDYTLLSPFFMFQYSDKKNLENTLLFGYSQGILNYQNINSPQALNIFNFNIFWPKSRIIKYINLSLILILISVNQLFFNRKKYNKSNQLILFTRISFSFTIFLSYLAWWFGSTPSDLPRHQFPVSVIIHLLAILNLCFIIDKVIQIKSKND